MTPERRSFLFWLAIVVAAVLALLSQCGSPTPTVIPAPTCDPCLAATVATEWAATKTMAAFTASPTSAPTHTPTASRTPTSTSTPTRTPTSTTEPTITATFVPNFWSARKSNDKIAKASSYVSVTIEYRGSPATIELPLINKTAWYGAVTPASARPNCPADVSTVDLCWQTADVNVEIGVYLLSTWQPGQVVTLKARLTQTTGETVETPIEWVIGGGGTPTLAPPWTPTPTRTPAASAQVWPAKEWTEIRGSGSGADLLFLVDTQSALAPYAELVFSDGDHCQAAWTNPTGDATWGWMRVTSPGCADCGQLRWVYASNPIEVISARWEGSFVICSDSLSP
jgi:hypothetical protein